MGGSRRRKAKTRLKVTIRPKKKPFSRTKIPTEVQSGSKDIQKKVGARAVWDAQHQLVSNYSANGFIADCNAAFGRNAGGTKNPIQIKSDSSGEEGPESDDDLRQIEGKARKDGHRTKPCKPTSHQQQIIARLLASHGNDIEAMVKDRKLNSMLLPASKLRRLIEGHHAAGTARRHQFRVPFKHL